MASLTGIKPQNMTCAPYRRQQRRTDRSETFNEFPYFSPRRYPDRPIAVPKYFTKNFSNSRVVVSDAQTPLKKNKTAKVCFVKYLITAIAITGCGTVTKNTWSTPYFFC